ncbi:Low-density lipoprotein receptor-related protein 8 [Liparis tanakae]|uniref:Low-density lipoprotein receptor-related protein 8 n=1 Tax=Liparis tanakae TaxID=230148 RepID=A0A4Z2IW67_9TELE|nr:Low-density lipoprotein receptor-related protein 8 [Liparis tanakae]
MTGLQQAGGGVREPGRGCCIAVGLSDVSAKSAGTDECEDGQFQCNNKRCIPTIWRCDDDDDCSDNSDEENCPRKTCAPAEFACLNGQCVPGRWRCDGEPECPDGSDEAEETCSKQTCPPEKFDCGGSTNKCVSLSWRCDGEKDCENGADEADCASVVTRGQAAGSRQQAAAQPARGHNPSRDAKACPSGEFMCGNRKCLATVYVCDGDDDCGDGSDELKCASPLTCGPNHLRCNTSECVPLMWSCDGDPDCSDSSDEGPERCGGDGVPYPPNRRTNCTAGEFRCANGECVRLSWKCDGDPDCKDKSDEADCRLNECMINNGGCSHVCTDRPIGFECQCPSGYQLLDKKTCGGKSPYLLFTNRHEIRRIDLVKRDYSQVVSTQKNAVALDLDVANNRVFCGAPEKDANPRMNLLSARPEATARTAVPFSTATRAFIHEASDPSQQVPLLDSLLQTPVGLALDWLQHNLYWADSGDKSISVASVDATKRRVLIDTDLSEPRAIALDPHHG